ncbi:flavin reductase family protein [Microvirga yunnanensis]|uniref:flavin reductase family protein n=1 Tax=Microvirga yunnanensis TaxID=2953740 RepID=UPI0021CADCAF|nr:flavin reductase family protein [Microvirga sp. HBU65207]
MMTADDRELLEEGDPALDSRTFRRCLGQFATGVAVITAESGEQRAGVTVNSFSSVSLDPPLVLWSISRKSRSFPVFQASDTFAVNILASDQIDVSRHFSSSEEDKFARPLWRPGRSGSPILNGVVGHFECRRIASHEGGDHVIHIGRVEHFARFSGEPLLFVQGRYGIAADHPDLPVGQETLKSAENPTSQEQSLIALLFRAQHYLSAGFDEHRQAEGVNLAVGRVLAGVYENPGVPLQALVRTTYLGERDAEDAVADLINRSYLARDANGGLTLTPAGRERREAIRSRWEDFQTQQTSGLSEADMHCAQRVLMSLIERNIPNP